MNTRSGRIICILTLALIAIQLISSDLKMGVETTIYNPLPTLLRLFIFAALLVLVELMLENDASIKENRSLLSDSYVIFWATIVIVLFENNLNYTEAINKGYYGARLLLGGLIAFFVAILTTAAVIRTAGIELYRNKNIEYLFRGDDLIGSDVLAILPTIVCGLIVFSGIYGFLDLHLAVIYFTVMIITVAMTGHNLAMHVLAEGYKENIEKYASVKFKYFPSNFRLIVTLVSICTLLGIYRATSSSDVTVSLALVLGVIVCFLARVFCRWCASITIQQWINYRTNKPWE